ncbi:MAG: spondin domain-containing protein [Planctomycetales bacterium]|nr:spondin domain-containing protein [Planctomycetales bacterium]
MRTRIFQITAIIVAAAAATSHATELMVTVENLQPPGGLFFTPTWVGFHDGTFDPFDAGGTASDAIEAIAEGGDTAPLSASFAGHGVDGTIAPGTPFGPSGSAFGGTASAMFTVDPASNGYISFASMIIPSNDAFFGNDDPMAYKLFDMNGNFAGPLTITINGSDIWDAGSEVNNKMGGAAFSALGGDSVDDSGMIAMHSGLDEFIGTETANGEMISSAFGADTAIARITVTQVPEPGTLALASIGGLALVGLGRRRR